MIASLATLLFFQLVGEVTVRALGLHFPGPVLGMLLLFVVLKVRGSLPSALEQTAQNFLKYLSLLFVPAGVGIMRHIALIQKEWFSILVTLFVSTIVTIAVTGGTMSVMQRWFSPSHKADQT